MRYGAIVCVPRCLSSSILYCSINSSVKTDCLSHKRFHKSYDDEADAAFLFVPDQIWHGNGNEMFNAILHILGHSSQMKDSKFTLVNFSSYFWKFHWTVSIKVYN